MQRHTVVHVSSAAESLWLGELLFLAPFFNPLWCQKPRLHLSSRQPNSATYFRLQVQVCKMQREIDSKRHVFDCRSAKCSVIRRHRFSAENKLLIACIPLKLPTPPQGKNRILPPRASLNHHRHNANPPGAPRPPQGPPRRAPRLPTPRLPAPRLPTPLARCT